MPNSATYLAEERRVAIDVVQTACRITTRVFQSLVSSDTLTKKDKSPVTIGDYSAQALVNLILAKHFPDDALVGEENAEDLRIDAGAGMRDQIVQLVNGVLPQGAERVPTEALLDAIDRGNYPGGKGRRFWALDPIDGTKGFLRGGQYAVCLALIVDGRVELGVMGCPNLPVDKTRPKPMNGSEHIGQEGLGTLFSVVRGQGAVQRGLEPDAREEPIRMRELSEFAQASFCESVDAGHSSLGTNARIAELLGIPRDRSVRMDSQAKYASIARGDGDIYLRLPVGDGSYQEKIWDHAAGALLVEEAGGTVSDLAGRPLDFGQGRTLSKNRGVVAAPQAMHARVIQAVAQALTEEGRGALLSLDA